MQIGFNLKKSFNVKQILMQIGFNLKKSFKRKKIST